MIKWVIFDIGGVVIDIAPKDVVTRLSTVSGLPVEKIAQLFDFKLVKTDDAQTFFEQFVVGRISVDEYVKSMQWVFPNKVSREEIIEAELLCLGADRKDTLALIRELERSVGLGCFSNTHQIHWDKLISEREWYSHFKHIYASHECGLAKPDPEVFHFMLRELGTKPEEMVFLDDVEKNVAAAKSCGWHAVHFRDAAQARSELSPLMRGK